MNIAKFSKILLLNLLFVILLSGCNKPSETTESTPTQTPIPGWVEYNNEEISLQLPAEFKILDNSSIDEEHNRILFTAQRNNFSEIAKLKLVIAVEEPIPLDQTDEYLKFMMDVLPESHQWISNEQVPLNTFPHGLMLSEAYDNETGFITYHTHFIFLDNKTYIFKFTTVADRYIVDNPEVDQIMNSVRFGENGYKIKKSPDGLCLVGLGAVLIFFVSNIWLRRRPWKTIKYS
jgi:hypothetical protein